MATKLSDADLQSELDRTPGWRVQDGVLTRAFTFDAYSSGAAFAVRVMMLAEKLDHHPDALTVSWKRVTVAFVTHSAGGLTALDFDAARKVAALQG
jgi:4a-hydroxytetrahydrobiopterin dehydratase